MESLQKTLPEYFQRAGWTVEKVLPFTNSVMFEVKKGFLEKATIHFQGAPQDLTLEVDGSGEAMDVAEAALTDSCDNPAALVGYKEQKKIEQQEVVKNIVGMFGPHAQAASAQPMTVEKEVVMIPCKYCGALMDDTATVCPNCGAKRTL